MGDTPIYSATFLLWRQLRDDLAELDAVETVADITYVYGEGWGES